MSAFYHVYRLRLYKWVLSTLNDFTNECFSTEDGVFSSISTLDDYHSSDDLTLHWCYLLKML